MRRMVSAAARPAHGPPRRPVAGMCGLGAWRRHPSGRFGSRNRLASALEKRGQGRGVGRLEGTRQHARRRWAGAFGSLAAWVAGTPSSSPQHGFRLEINRGREFVWAAGNNTDIRAARGARHGLESEIGSLLVRREPGRVRADTRFRPAYRLSVYLLDFDRAGRSVRVSLVDGFGQALDARDVPCDDLSNGVYLSWTVTRAAGPGPLHRRQHQPPTP